MTHRSLSTCLSYDLPPACRAPLPGEYIATAGKRGRGSRYLILGVRKVRHRKAAPLQRYMLTYQRDVPEGPAEWTLYWYSRDSKRKTQKAVRRGH